MLGCTRETSLYYLSYLVFFFLPPAGFFLLPVAFLAPFVFTGSSATGYSSLSFNVSIPTRSLPCNSASRCAARTGFWLRSQSIRTDRISERSTTVLRHASKSSWASSNEDKLYEFFTYGSTPASRSSCRILLCPWNVAKEDAFQPLDSLAFKLAKKVFRSTLSISGSNSLYVFRSISTRSVWPFQAPIKSKVLPLSSRTSAHPLGRSPCWMASSASSWSRSFSSVAFPSSAS
mmetsp:Transcript_19019/g.35191  ORF Transcript_19019/g.35191 Transcript_19019/m.35191 type:complete len:232 (-) Transcript_19019:13-708(-)